MTVYVVCRKWQEDFDFDLGVAHDLDAAIKVANRLVDEVYADGYTLDPDYNDYGSAHFTTQGYKTYIDGDGDYSVAIWIEEQIVL